MGAEGRMIIGYIHPGTIHQCFMDSIFQFMVHDAKHRNIFNGYLTAECAYIPDARNKVCEAFLLTQEEWLFMMDYDIVFDPIAVYQLLDSADPINRPIICGLYVTRFGDGNKIRPCWMEQVGEVEHVACSTVTIGEIKPCTTVGMGFTLIHRSVLEKLKEIHANDPWHWFGHDMINGNRVGEDITFCSRSRKAGFKVWGHAGVLLGHKKSSILTAMDIKHVPLIDKKVLNIGAGGQKIVYEYPDYHHFSLDIDPQTKPDIVADARDLSKIDDKFDVVYCSHNLEHYTPDDAKKVLNNFKGILNENGIVHIRVPDIGLVMNDGKGLDETRYISPSGPITGQDMISGWSKVIETNEFMRHKNCFTAESLESMLLECGYRNVEINAGNYELTAIGHR